MAKWSPNGARIMTAGTENVIRIWDAKTGAELLALHPPPGIYGIGAEWSPAGQYVSHGGLGTPTSVWRVWQSADELPDYSR